MVTAIALIVIYRVIAVFYICICICIINAEFRGNFVTCNKTTIV